jgi:hypothetical protein
LQAICTSMILAALVSTVVPAFQRSANAHQLVSTRTGFLHVIVIAMRHSAVQEGWAIAMTCGSLLWTVVVEIDRQALDVLPALDGPPPGSESGPLSHGNGKYTKERVIRGTCGLFYCGDSAMWSAEQPRGMHVASSRQQVG